MSPRKPEQPVGQGDWRIMPWLLQAVVMLKSWASSESGEKEMCGKVTLKGAQLLGCEELLACAIAG